MDTQLRDEFLLIAATESNETISNTNRTEIDSFYFYQTEQFTFLVILLVSIIAGNISVLITLQYSKSNKSRMNFFIKHLAFADLLVGLINVLTDIIWRITIAWYAGNILCKIIRYSQVVVTYSSTYVLVALSIDRYDAIRYPMNFTSSWQRAKCLVGSAWLISFIFSSPILIFYEEKLVQDQPQCWIEFPKDWHWQLYMTIVAVTLFIIPAVIITGCYTFIVITIWTKSKIMVPNVACGQRSKTQRKSLASKRASSRGLIPRAKIKTIKMTFVIVFVFIICWSPYILFDLLQVYGYIPKTQTNIAVATFIQSLAPLNSAANPIIYCVFSTHMCKAWKKNPVLSLLLCRCDKSELLPGTSQAKSHPSQSSSNTRTTSMSEILTLNPKCKSTPQKHVNIQTSTPI